MFSFEAERRGAAEVIGIENYPPMARKFEICRAALGSNARSYLTNVYDLTPNTLGTFDLVMFFGVLYHLRHPLLALQRIQSVCTGTLLMQSSTCDNTSDKPMAEFHPFGIQSGPRDNPSRDRTCFWFANVACCMAMLRHVGFTDVTRISPKPRRGGIFRFLPKSRVAGVFRGQAAVRQTGQPPIEQKAPWS